VATISQLKKQVLERLLSTELTQHLGYAKGAAAGGNSRNGHSAKALLSDDGPLELAIPRDRNGTFEPRRSRQHGGGRGTRWFRCSPFRRRSGA